MGQESGQNLADQVIIPQPGKKLTWCLEDAAAVTLTVSVHSLYNITTVHLTSGNVNLMLLPRFESLLVLFFML